MIKGKPSQINVHGVDFKAEDNPDTQYHLEDERRSSRAVIDNSTKTMVRSNEKEQNLFNQDCKAYVFFSKKGKNQQDSAREQRKGKGKKKQSKLVLREKDVVFA